MWIAARNPGDCAVIRATPFRKTIPAHRELAFIGAMLLSSVIFIDGSATIIALPLLGTDFHLTGAQLQWLLNAYLLPLTALSLFAGAIGDRYGRQRTLLFGGALFNISLILCSRAESLEALLAGRVGQGIGAAFLIPNALAGIGQMYSGRAEERAIGVWSGFAAVASGISPTLGGWLVDLGNWRGLFLLSLPIVVIGMSFTALYLPNDREAPDQPTDTAGGVLVTVLLLALVSFLGNVELAASSPILAFMGATAIALLAAWFLYVEVYRGECAMIPLSLFQSLPFSALTLFTFLLYGAFNILFVLLPFLLMQGAGYSGFQAGLIFVPLQVVMTLGSPLISNLASYVGWRSLLAFGSALTGFAFLVALFVDLSTSYWVSVMPVVALTALGMCCVAAPLSTLVLTIVDGRSAGVASGLNNTTSRFGGLVTTALMSTVLADHGTFLTSGFDAAMIGGATLCVLATISAVFIRVNLAGNPL
jgi:MFS family permease